MHSKKQKEKILKKRMKIRRMMVLLCLFIPGGLLGCSDSKESQQTELVEVQEECQTEDKRAGKAEQEADAPVQEEKKCYVHVCGAVNSPGVYELKADSRLYEAIALAGGLTEQAAGEALNQAQKVEDGSRIYVPDKEEYAAGTGDVSAAGKDTAKNDTSGEDKKVNLNTATKEELMTLSGIGEAKASAIISYRESHGGFQKIEEMMQVEGIKDGVFQKVKDQIKV